MTTKQEFISWLLTHAGVESEYNRNLIYNTAETFFQERGAGYGKHKVEILKLAGKLAISARDVILSGVDSLSENAARMREILDEYDNKVLSEAMKETI